MKPTQEQVAIVAAGRTGKGLVVQAGAGTGKTSTLKMIATATKGRRGLYIAYNKAIATEAAGTFPEHVNCRTAHSLAMAAVGYKYRHRLGGARQTAQRAAELIGATWVDLGVSLRVSPVQAARIAIDTIRAFCYSSDDEVLGRHVPAQNGILGEDHAELVRAVVPLARRAWIDICSTDGLLRFEHDHYLKIWAMTRPRLDADVVMLDEAQDSNPVVAQLVQDQGHAQQIAVGDSCQSLYGWRGAVDALGSWPADERLYLSQSWRFGPVIASEANKWLALLDTPLRLSGNPAIASEVLTSLEAPDAVLCRTNAEALRQVMSALDAGEPVALVGGGAVLKKLAEAASELKDGRRTSHPELYVFATWGALQDYVESEAAGRDLKPFVDLIDAHGTDVVIDAVDALVDERRARIVVSTAHKAKGREWEAVKIADDYPEAGTDTGKAADGSARADAMLAYVAVTRARARLDRGSLAWIDQHVSANKNRWQLAATTAGGQVVTSR